MALTPEFSETPSAQLVADHGRSGADGTPHGPSYEELTPPSVARVRAGVCAFINDPPLPCRKNHVIGGVAPSDYLAKLEAGNQSTPSIPRQRLDSHLESHLLDPSLLWADDFSKFMADRQARLLALIEQATGKAAYAGSMEDEGEDVEDDADAVEATHTIASQAPTT